MKRIIIFRNKRKSGSASLADSISALVGGCFDCISVDSPEEARALVAEGAFAAICIGGDGTILAVANEAAESGTPILGINLGHLGYMAGLEADELGLLSRLCDGNFETEKRFMLEARVSRATGEEIPLRALNEVLISRGAEPKILDFSLSCSGTDVAVYRADGMIFSTPTGSTAYALSAGSAIIDPALSLISVCPVCPHTFSGARPLVFSPCSRLRVTVTSSYDCDIYLTVDGKAPIRLLDTDTVDITGSERTVSFIKLKDNCFYQTLYKKFKAGE